MQENMIDPNPNQETYVAKSYRTRGRSLKSFFADLDLVLEQGELTNEAFFDICQCICETGIIMWCPKIAPVKSYGFRTLDGKYSMSSKNINRSLLTFIGKTIPVRGLYTDRQVRRLKAIVRLLALELKEKADDITLKGTLKWLE